MVNIALISLLLDFVKAVIRNGNVNRLQSIASVCACVCACVRVCGIKTQYINK